MKRNVCLNESTYCHFTGPYSLLLLNTCCLVDPLHTKVVCVEINCEFAPDARQWSISTTEASIRSIQETSVTASLSPEQLWTNGLRSIRHTMDKYLILFSPLTEALNTRS